MFQHSFGIDGSSGELTTLRRFDYESKNFYQLSVAATDLGASPRQTVVPVTVSVRDLQDNSPLFEGSTYTRSVPEGVAGASVITLFVSF